MDRILRRSYLPKKGNSLQVFSKLPPSLKLSQLESLNKQSKFKSCSTVDIKGLLSGFSQYRESITITLLLIFPMCLMEEILDEESKRLGPVRVAKCQLFYTEQNLQTKFYPNKSTLFWYCKQTKITKGMILDNKKDWFCKHCVFFQIFTPTLKYFYTDVSVKICDILQLWVVSILLRLLRKFFPAGREVVLSRRERDGLLGRKL